MKHNGDSQMDNIPSPEGSFDQRMMQVSQDEPLRTSPDVRRKTPRGGASQLANTHANSLKNAGIGMINGESGSELPELIKGNSSAVSPHKKLPPAKARWQRLSNVIRGINLMKKSEVRTILSAQEVISEIGKSPGQSHIS